MSDIEVFKEAHRIQGYLWDHVIPEIKGDRAAIGIALLQVGAAMLAPHPAFLGTAIAGLIQALGEKSLKAEGSGHV